MHKEESAHGVCTEKCSEDRNLQDSLNQIVIVYDMHH